MEAISRSCLPAAAARTKRQRKATCCGVLGAASHRTTCARSSADKLTSGLILAMHTYISYWPQYVYLFMIHTTSNGQHSCREPDDYGFGRQYHRRGTRSEGGSNHLFRLLSNRPACHGSHIAFGLALALLD